MQDQEPNGEPDPISSSMRPMPRMAPMRGLDTGKDTSSRGTSPALGVHRGKFRGGRRRGGRLRSR